MTTVRVLIACLHLQRHMNRYRGLFERHNIDFEMPHIDQQLSEAELVEIIDRFHGVVAGDDEFTACVLERATRLKVISKWGVGVDSVDRATAERLGIKVFNTPNVFADEVGDVAIGYIIMLARKLHKMDQSVRTGGWLKVEGMSLRGKVLGIIGAGSIGRGIARRARALGMEILAYDPVPVPPAVIEETGLRQVSLDELLAQSDFVSLSCNLTNENCHMLGVEQLARMKDGAYLLNVARGPLIDEAALVGALDSRKLAGAALDVFEREPLPLDSPLRQFNNCIFGTHNGSNTLEAILRVNAKAIANLFRGLGIATA